MIYVIENNLKYCRNEIGMTQSELGFVFGVHKSTVANWENGYDIIPLSKLIRFCNLYDYSIDFVLGLSRKNNVYNDKICTDKKITGMKLKKLRKDLKLTQKDMADVCAISREAYCHYELGMNLITTLTLYTLCKSFNISMDDFLRK